MNELTSRVFIELKNQFLGLFADPSAVMWHLKIEHPTFRTFKTTLENRNLRILLEKALDELNQFEKGVENMRSALRVLHPNLDEYQIAELLRSKL